MAVRPVILTSDEQVPALLRGRRQALGISQQELDDRIGCADGYIAKLESGTRARQEGGTRGYGRGAIWGFTKTLSWWLESLGLCMVIMDRETADALIARSDAPDLTASVHQPYAGRSRRRDIVQRHVLRMQVSFPAPRQRA